jgi:TonB-dependent siderophore receptor
MWKKTLFAAAVTGFALSSRAADPEPPIPPPAAPTAPRDDDATKLETIVIEGTRTGDSFKAEEQVSGKLPLTIRETPQSISVITREALDDRQVFNLQQALELSAGVTQFSGTGPFAGQPAFGFNQTTIRGMAIDDQYDFRDDGFVSGSYFALPDLAIYDHLEVVKGANSVLYGRGSVGGLINRVRKKPLAASRTEMEVSAGSFDTYRADFDVTGPMFESKTVRGRLVAAYEDSGSFVRGVGTERVVLAPSVEVDVTASTRLLLQALHQAEDIIPNTGVPLRKTDPNNPQSNYRALDISRRKYLGTPTGDPYQWTIDSLTAQLEQDLGDRWLASLRLSQSNLDTPNHADAYVYSFNEGVTEGSTRGDTLVQSSDFEIDRDIFSAELQLNGRIDLRGREVKLGFGADFNENQYSRRGMYSDYVPANVYDDSFPDPGPPLNPGGTSSGKPKSEGVYAQAQVPLTDRLKALLGVRYDKVHLNTVPYHTTGEPGPDALKENVDDVTGRVGLTFDLNQNITLYTVYAQSFSPELFATDINGELLEPETGEVFEVGTKTEWFDRRLGLTTAIYRIDRDNVPVSVPRNPAEPNGPTYSIPSGLQRSEGFEIEANGRPMKGWDISLAFNTVDSEFKDKRDPFYGHQPGGAADWQVGLYSAYEIQTGPAKGLGFGGTYYEIADRGVSAFQLGTIPGYKRIDAHAFYKGFRNVEINLLIRNVTDEKYIEGADRPGAIAFFGSPTAALLSVKYTLGGS